MGCGESAQACCSPTSQPTATLPPGRAGWGEQVTERVWGKSVFLSDCLLGGESVLGKVDVSAERSVLPNYGV